VVRMAVAHAFPACVGAHVAQEDGFVGAGETAVFDVRHVGNVVVDLEVVALLEHLHVAFELLDQLLRLCDAALVLNALQQHHVQILDVQHIHKLVLHNHLLVLIHFLYLGVAPIVVHRLHLLRILVLDRVDE